MNKIDDIVKLFMEELKEKAQVQFVDCTKTESKVTLTIDPVSRLFIEIEESGITVLYADEHDNFWLKPYKNEKAFIDDVTKFVIRLLHNNILIEYFYSGSVLVRYRIYTIDNATNYKKLLKTSTVSLNPFLWLLPKSTTSKVICFNSNTK